MAQTAPPTQAQLIALMARAGFTVAATEADLANGAAADEFQRRVGTQILAPAGTVAHVYDPPISGCLDLRRALMTLTSVVHQPQGGSAEVLTQNTDYVLMEYTPVLDVEPNQGRYWAIEFLTRRWTFPLAPGNRRSLIVTGTWGLWTAAAGMPDDVFQALLHRAGAMLLTELGSFAAVARTQQSEVGVQTSWGSDPNSGVRREWNAEFEAAVKRYRPPGLAVG